MDLNGQYINVPLDWAMALGLNDAVFLKKLYDWLKWAERKGGVYHHRDGRCWIYNSYPEWHKQLPMFSPRTIRRIVDRLVEKRVLLTKRLNAHASDQTLWYSIDEEVLSDVAKVATSRWPKWPPHETAKVATSSLYNKNNTTTEGEPEFEIREDLLPFIEE